MLLDARWTSRSPFWAKAYVRAVLAIVVLRRLSRSYEGVFDGGGAGRQGLAHAEAIMASRIVCEQHFRSVTAGAARGILIAKRLMAKPEHQAAFAAAYRDLVAVRGSH